MQFYPPRYFRGQKTVKGFPPGRTTRTLQTIQKVQEFIQEDRNAPIRTIAEVLECIWWRLIPRIIRERPENIEQRSWILLHNAILARSYLAKKHVFEIDHPPYSPDLTPWGFFLFLKLKMHLKGCYFDDVETIKATVARILKAIPVNDHEHSINSNFCHEIGVEFFNFTVRCIM